MAGFPPGRPEDGGHGDQAYAETIITKGEHGWTVRFKDLWEHSLGNDEALWCLFQQMNGEPGRYLRSAEQHAEWNRRHRQRDVTAGLEDWQKLLPKEETECA